ncbi:hypothetical protein ACU3L3_09880 [Priestia endophytica]|uniref:Uncharacterized protein n=1 Tax=Priestia endophytica DSM 13796 TaxID=1121089 RepID=A0A1I6BVB8_9BACI|nr:hypothetical protein [Priestia endophytica]KYG30380.1 hypothetical protein AZF06_24630 [Priestia endophytica]SFQ84855.1 hypothetical protein SAMN02745910_04301 [Priestia endophytica DSM 13796]
MFTIENHIASLKEGLQRHSDALIHCTKETLTFNYYEKIDLLDFTAFVQSFGLDIVMFSMDRGAGEVFYEGNEISIFAGSYNLLEDIEYYHIPDEKKDEFWTFYEEADYPISEAETKVIVEWFADCWNKANGKSVSLPAYFSFHDYDPFFDLYENKWITDGDKWDY